MKLPSRSEYWHSGIIKFFFSLRNRFSLNLVSRLQTTLYTTCDMFTKITLIREYWGFAAKNFDSQLCRKIWMIYDFFVIQQVTFSHFLMNVLKVP